MKTGMTVVAALVLLAAKAGATDIAGKWGIGASLFNSGIETSLIHGHSERTAWTLSFLLNGRSSDLSLTLISPVEITDQNRNSNTWRIGARPSIRRFTRPSSDFSPYGDWFAFFGSGRF